MTEQEKGYLIEHMKMTQDIIARMNRNSFQLKGWMLTIVAAFLALYGNSTNNNVVYIWVAIAPTGLFWFLDAFYLKKERKYVAMHKKLMKIFNGVESIKNIKIFDLSTKEYKKGRYNYFAVLFSMTEWGLYLTVIIGLIIIGIVLQ